MNPHNLMEINSLNQRGGRMLSIVDLIERKTITLEIAAFILNRVLNEESFLIVAKPGGAGKTAIQGAILGLIPDSEKIITIKNAKFLREIKKEQQKKEIDQRTTYIAHEIGSGSWYGYLWGKAAAQFLRIRSKNIRIISNMHEDELPLIYKTFSNFGAPESDLNNFDNILRIRYNQKTGERIIDRIWRAEHGRHVQVFADGKIADLKNDSKITVFRHFSLYVILFQEMVDDGIKRIENVHDFLYSRL